MTGSPPGHIRANLSQRDYLLCSKTLNSESNVQRSGLCVSIYYRHISSALLRNWSNVSNEYKTYSLQQQLLVELYREKCTRASPHLFCLIRVRCVISFESDESFFLAFSSECVETPERLSNMLIFRGYLSFGSLTLLDVLAQDGHDAECGVMSIPKYKKTASVLVYVTTYVVAMIHHGQVIVIESESKVLSQSYDLDHHKIDQTAHLQ